jgi:hypothetical protein
MEKICEAPLACLAHGLALPCDLCSLENSTAAACSVCGVSVSSSGSLGARACMGWLASTPTYAPCPVDTAGQAASIGSQSLSTADTWIDRLSRAGLEVDRSQGILRLPGRDQSEGSASTFVVLRFSDKSVACLSRAADARTVSAFDTYSVSNWTPEIRFDDGVLFWKELSIVERADEDGDPSLPDGLEQATESTLCIQPWTELRSVKVTVLRPHDPSKRTGSGHRAVEPLLTSAAGSDQTTLAESSSGELTVLFDSAAERDMGVKFTAVEATCPEPGVVRVVGELVTTSGERLDDYRELQFVVYDCADKILGRGYTNWSEFGRRQSFDEELTELRSTAKPAKVRVFPSS